MTLRVSCQSCKSTFNVAEQHAGKKANCPKCGSQIMIGAPTPGDTRVVPSAAPPPQEALETPSTSFWGRRFGVTGPRLRRSVVAGAVLLALGVGYFVGREHVKYEIRSAISEAGKALAESLEEAFADSKPSEEPSAEPGAAEIKWESDLKMHAFGGGKDEPADD